MAHIQEKGWYFLIRIKDGHGSIKSNLELPKEKLFDLKINLNITRKQSKEVKELLKDKNHYRYLPSNVNFDYLPAKSNYKDPASFYGLQDSKFQKILMKPSLQIWIRNNTLLKN